MTSDDVVQIMCLVADLRRQLVVQDATIAELNRRLELATAAVKHDDEALADLARSLDAIA